MRPRIKRAGIRSIIASALFQGGSGADFCTGAWSQPSCLNMATPKGGVGQNFWPPHWGGAPDAAWVPLRELNLVYVLNHVISYGLPADHLLCGVRRLLRLLKTP